MTLHHRNQINKITYIFIGSKSMGLFDSVAKKATKELQKQAKSKSGKEIEKKARKELKKRFKI
jgi:hypothetical protein